MKRLHYLGICLILVFVALDLGCTSKEKPVECTQASDCSDKVHIMCVGKWSCIENKCVWNCESEATIISIQTTTTLGRKHAKEGEFCGGIAGILCDAGLQCKLDGKYPDASGVCIRENKECLSDLDCAVGGCSNQICASKEKASDLVTTCEWREEYSCYRMTSCGCIQGVCQWKETSEFNECLKKLGVG